MSWAPTWKSSPNLSIDPKQVRNTIPVYIYAISLCIFHSFDEKVKYFSVLLSVQYELLCSILSSFCDVPGCLFWYCFLSFITILFLLHFVKNKEDYIKKDFQKLCCFSRKKVHIFLLLVFFYFITFLDIYGFSLFVNIFPYFVL